MKISVFKLNKREREGKRGILMTTFYKSIAVTK